MIYCNRALEEWVGCKAEQLIGQRLRYRTVVSRQKAEIIAAALAPPPETFQGKHHRAILTIDHITTMSRRGVDFYPFSPGGILALVGEKDLSPDQLGPPQESCDSAERQAATELHQALQAQRRRQAGRFRWDRLIGASQQMQRIRRLGRLAVESTASVLILGELGTGKEHLASAIHYGFPSEKPGAFVPIECSVLDDDLIASTIIAFRKRFQQEKSTRRHTLFLKDAESLSESFMPIILDFLAGAATNQRIIATSTILPESWTNHESLPILLGTIRVDLPPLRARREDIPLLAQMFLEENNQTASRQRAGFTSDALDLLVQYDWPDNIQELELFIEEAHTRGESALVSSGDLPDRIRKVFDAASVATTDDKPIDLIAVLERIEKELIERALELARGNKSKAAELLGLTRPRLYRRMEYFGLLEESAAD